MLLFCTITGDEFCGSDNDSAICLSMYLAVRRPVQGYQASNDVFIICCNTIIINYCMNSKFIENVSIAVLWLKPIN